MRSYIVLITLLLTALVGAQIQSNQTIPQTSCNLTELKNIEAIITKIENNITIISNTINSISSNFTKSNASITTELNSLNQSLIMVREEIDQIKNYMMLLNNNMSYNLTIINNNLTNIYNELQRYNEKILQILNALNGIPTKNYLNQSISRLIQNSTSNIVQNIGASRNTIIDSISNLNRTITNKLYISYNETKNNFSTLMLLVSIALALSAVNLALLLFLGRRRTAQAEICA